MFIEMKLIITLFIFMLFIIKIILACNYSFYIIISEDYYTIFT